MSTFLNLDWKDALNGFLFAVTGAVLTGILTLLQTGTFTIAELKVIGITGAIAGITYILKRFFSGETGTIGK